MTTLAAFVNIRNAAVKRHLGRRRKPSSKWVTDEVRNIRVQLRDTGPEIAEALNVSEWLDDRLVRLTGQPGGRLLAEVLEAARQGARPAVAALSAAVRLNAVEQYGVWYVLTEVWRPEKQPAFARPLQAALIAEWRRLGLQTSPPTQNQRAEIDRAAWKAWTDDHPDRHRPPGPPIPAGLSFARVHGWV
jgi:hypothetical protein